VTSDQIKNDNNLDSQYFWIWLKECAYQLALIQEEFQRRNQALGSTVPTAPDSALRGNRELYEDVAAQELELATVPPASNPALHEEDYRHEFKHTGKYARVEICLECGQTQTNYIHSGEPKS
jgi:hypothetical protein